MWPQNLLICHDGDGGIFVADGNLEFLAPVYTGDYIEARGERDEIDRVGVTSRHMKLEAYKIITLADIME